MATKKTTAEAEPNSRESELLEALEQMKKEREEMLKEMEALKNGDKEVAQTNPVSDEDYWNERVPYEAFFDGDRYVDDISVKVNGKRFLIQRGKVVMIPRYVVHVLENQVKQQKYSAEYNRSLQDDFARDTKRYIGE